MTYIVHILYYVYLDDSISILHTCTLTLDSSQWQRESCPWLHLAHCDPRELSESIWVPVTTVSPGRGSWPCSPSPPSPGTSTTWHCCGKNHRDGPTLSLVTHDHREYGGNLEMVIYGEADMSYPIIYNVHPLLNYIATCIGNTANFH